MDVSPVLLTFLAFNIAATWIRDLDPWIFALRISWFYFRVVAFLAGIMSLYFYVARYQILFSTIVYLTIGCQSSIETMQAYTYTALRESRSARLSALYADSIVFVIIFVIPVILCLSPILPRLSVDAFVYFTIPTTINSCGQLLINFQICHVTKSAKLKSCTVHNAIRALTLIILLTVSASCLTTKMQRIISAAILFGHSIPQRFDTFPPARHDAPADKNLRAEHPGTPLSSVSRPPPTYNPEEQKESRQQHETFEGASQIERVASPVDFLRMEASQHIQPDSSRGHQSIRPTEILVNGIEIWEVLEAFCVSESIGVWQFQYGREHFALVQKPSDLKTLVDDVRNELPYTQPSDSGVCTLAELYHVLVTKRLTALEVNNHLLETTRAALLSLLRTRCQDVSYMRSFWSALKGETQWACTFAWSVFVSQQLTSIKHPFEDMEGHLVDIVANARGVMLYLQSGNGLVEIAVPWASSALVKSLLESSLSQIVA